MPSITSRMDMTVAKTGLSINLLNMLVLVKLTEPVLE
jgi:hypothetical protein